MEEFLILLEEDIAAEYLNMIPDSYAELRKNNMDIQFWGIEEWDEAAGVMVTEKNGEETLLRYLYLREESRGRGLASRMLTELEYACYKAGSHYLTVRYVKNRYPALQNLLIGMGGEEILQDIGSFSLTLGALKERNVLYKKSHSCISLKECNAYALKCLQEEMEKAGDDLIEIPIRTAWYEPCSAVYYKKEKAQGMLLVRKLGEKALEVQYIVSYAKEPDAVPDMIRFCLEKGLELYSEDTVCEFHIVDRTLLMFLERVLGRGADRMTDYKIALSKFDRIRRETEETIPEQPEV